LLWDYFFLRSQSFGIPKCLTRYTVFPFHQFSFAQSIYLIAFSVPPCIIWLFIFKYFNFPSCFSSGCCQLSGFAFIVSLEFSYSPLLCTLSSILQAFSLRQYLKNAVFLDVKPVILLRTDVWEEHIASIIRVVRIGELGTALAATSNRNTLRRKTYNLYIVHYKYVIPSTSIFLSLVMESV
jgi:hypothetical protein